MIDGISQSYFRTELQRLCDKYDIAELNISLSDEGIMKTLGYKLRDKAKAKKCDE